MVAAHEPRDLKTSDFMHGICVDEYMFCENFSNYPFKIAKLLLFDRSSQFFKIKVWMSELKTMCNT